MPTSSMPIKANIQVAAQALKAWLGEGSEVETDPGTDTIFVVNKGKSRGYPMTMMGYKVFFGFPPRKLETVECPVDVENTYKVNSRRWRYWNRVARMEFNKVYKGMLLNHDAQAGEFGVNRVKIKSGQWEVISWNAAWIAADSIMEIVKKGKVKG